jgi:hypothetical protein
MATWGIAISSNDTYADIYSDFFCLYNDGLDVTEISQSLIVKNQETINDPDDSNNFWFALAKAQWECKRLEKELYIRVKKIVDTDVDLEIWRQLNADEKDIKKRKLILAKFLSVISTERPNAKPRKKKIIRQPLFEKGDCLTFQFENNNYGGAVVLEAVRNTELGLNLIAMTRINQLNQPSNEDFQNADVLIKSFASWKNEPDIGWYYVSSFKRENIKIEVVGNIDVEVIYNPQDYSAKYYYGGSDGDLVKIPMLQFEFEKTNSKPLKKLKIKEITKRNKWKFW